MTTIDKSVRKKLRSYIESNKYKKMLKLYHAVDPDARVTSSGLRGLHVAARAGSSDCLLALLSLGANVRIKDDSGCFALHHAAKFCMKHYSPGNYKDLVQVLVDRHRPDDLFEKNKKGTACRTLVNALKRMGDVESESESESESDPESEWMDKLQAEHEEEFHWREGKFSSGSEFEYLNDETFDDWAERIYKEFSRRHRPQKTVEPKVKDEPKDEPKSEPKKKLKLDKSKSNQYKKKCSLVFTTDRPIRSRDLPFTLDSSGDVIVSTILEANEDEDAKTYLKNEIRRWHPDKFMQLNGGRIAEGEEESVKGIVTHVCQAIIKYGRKE